MTQTVITQLQHDLARDAVAFLPELILCGTIVLLLLVRLFKTFDRSHLGYMALVFTASALVVSWLQWQGDEFYDPRVLHGTSSLQLFSGMLVYDNFTIFLRLFLLGFTVLTIWLTLLTGIPDTEDSADFYVLLLGAVLGMSIMASSNHLMMVFIGVEMASLPSYALAGFLKGRRQSSEASLKYVVYGGGAAGVMLYGISLIAGKFGTGYLPDVAAALVAGPVDTLLLLGCLFLLVGVAFKLAAVPFHFWCPDVFEGAAAEVAGFLSVASKGAALALLGRLVLTAAGPVTLDSTVSMPARWLDWDRVAPVLVPALALGAAGTATFGNLAAYAQTNLKRLLAYSTIAHAGYMMMGFVPLNVEGAGAVLFYLVAYLFMNLGAFAIVAFLRNQTGSEDLADFRGLVQRSPLLVIMLSVCLLSLLGLPPLVGFAAKFQIFSVLYESAQAYGKQGQTNLSVTLYGLLVIGGLNTVLSLLYYAKVLKVMILEKPLEEVEGRPVEQLRLPWQVGLYATVMAVAVLALGVFWGPLDAASRIRGVEQFRPAAAPAAQVTAQVDR